VCFADGSEVSRSALTTNTKQVLDFALSATDIQKSIMAEFFLMNAIRVCKCKICEENIAVGEQMLKLNNVHVSPNYRDLHFHEKCIKEAIKKAYKL